MVWWILPVECPREVLCSKATESTEAGNCELVDVCVVRRDRDQLHTIVMRK